MPEGDTLARTAAGLRPHLVGRAVVAARARRPGPRVERLIGATVTATDARGKHLLICFDSGLVLRSHLGMTGSWHRYRPGERWRRAPSRAQLVLEVPGTVAVLFDASSVDLFEDRAALVHPVLSALGPDILADDFDAGTALSRLREPARSGQTVAEALLDQRGLAGIGNVYRNEALFIERVHPLRALAEVDDATLARLIATARRLMRANTDVVARDTVAEPRRTASPRRARLWVYGRAGRPCRRCGAPIESRRHGELPRRSFWCPACQASPDASTGPSGSPPSARR